MTEEEIKLAMIYEKRKEMRMEPTPAFFSALGIRKSQSNFEKFLCLADAAGTFTNEQINECGMFTNRLMASRKLHGRMTQDGYMNTECGTLGSFKGGRSKIYSITPAGHRMAESVRGYSSQIHGRVLTAAGRNKEHNIHIQDTIFQLAPYWPDGTSWKTEAVQSENTLRPDAVLEMNGITVYVEEDTGKQRESVLTSKLKRYRDIYNNPESATILFTLLDFVGSRNHELSPGEQELQQIASAISQGKAREQTLYSAASVIRDDIYRGLDVIAALNRLSGEILPYLFPGVLFHPERVLEQAGIVRAVRVTGGEMLPYNIHPRCSIYGIDEKCIHVEAVSHSISGTLRSLALCRYPVMLMLLFETYMDAISYLRLADIHAHALLYIYIYAQEDGCGLYFYDGACLCKIWNEV